MKPPTQMTIVIGLGALALAIATPAACQEQTPGKPGSSITRTEKLHVTHDSETITAGHHQPSVGEAVARAEDAELSIKVKAALNDDARLVDDPISVSANHGTVTLKGEVAAQDHVKLAESVAAAVPGASFVLNEVTWPITDR